MNRERGLEKELKDYPVDLPWKNGTPEQEQKSLLKAA